MPHVVSCPFVFSWFYERREVCWKLWKMIIFQFFFSVWVISPSFRADKGVNYVRIAQDNKSVTCSCVPNCCYFIFWVGFTRRSVHSYEKSSFLRIFSLLCSSFLRIFSLFPQLLCRWGSSAYIRSALNDRSATCKCVANEF